MRLTFNGSSHEGLSFIQTMILTYKNIPPNDLLGGIDEPIFETITLGMGSDPQV